VPGGRVGEVRITIFWPVGSVGVLPVVLYTHGAGWVFGGVHTHDRLVRELTTRAEAKLGSDVRRHEHGGQAHGRDTDAQ
jgi:acetyl esterase